MDISSRRCAVQEHPENDGPGIEAAATARPSAPAQRSSGESPASPSSRSASRAPTRRPRTRRSFFGPRPGTTDPLLAPLLETVSSVSPKENLSLLQRAYLVAERAHRGQTRKSGDPYITHPVSAIGRAPD